MPDEEMITCPGCGRQISASYNVCPNCGRPVSAPPQGAPQPAYGPQPYPPQPMPQPAYGPQPYSTQPVGVPVGGVLTILLYLASFFVFPIGIITGVMWLGLGADFEKQRIGKNCLILGIVGIIIGVILTVVIIGAIVARSTG